MEDIIKDPETTEETIEEEVKEEETEVEETIEEEVKEEEAEDKEEKEEESEIDYLDRLQRTMAEFDNYRKRTEKEKSAMYDLGLTDTVLSILPVLDNFERALESACTDKAYADGMEMIYKQMLDLLDSIGVTQIEAKGQKFDTNLHDAVMHIEDDKYGENEVIEELQKGYIYKEEKVIRYSMVQVAN
mgnify:CR=1 FL=1